MILPCGWILGLVLWVLPVICPAGPAAAAETILLFHSDVTVSENGTLLVRETIRVRAEGRQIRRGIYRDFPTRYTDRLGNHHRVGFEFLAAERDGQPEAWHQQPQSNGVRTYLGREERFLPHGEHTYVLTYRTSGQLGFFADFDELYWNVTGNGWELPIREASCTVILPNGIPADQLRTAGYTGPMGSTERAVAIDRNSDGTVTFRATRNFGPREGLTVAVGWPKGHVREPTKAEQTRRFFGANPELRTGLIGMALLLTYYGFAWLKVGRDPQGGVVIPRYEPPAGL
jgi:hypothetical protein